MFLYLCRCRRPNPAHSGEQLQPQRVAGHSRQRRPRPPQGRRLPPRRLRGIGLRRARRLVGPGVEQDGLLLRRARAGLVRHGRLRRPPALRGRVGGPAGDGGRDDAGHGRLGAPLLRRQPSGRVQRACVDGAGGRRGRVRRRGVRRGLERLLPGGARGGQGGAGGGVQQRLPGSPERQVLLHRRVRLAGKLQADSILAALQVPLPSRVQLRLRRRHELEQVHGDAVSRYLLPSGEVGSVESSDGSVMPWWWIING